MRRSPIPACPKLLPAALALLAAIAAPAPAHAFLDDLIGGDDGACGADDGGLLGGTGAAAGSILGGNGDPSDPLGGCPIVESAPLVVEGLVNSQMLELVLQTAHMATQIDNLIRMRALSGLDQGGEIAGRLSGARAAAGLVERVLWRMDAVDADFQELYPYALPTGLDAAGLAAHQAEQARLARESSHASKLVTADAVTAIEAYPARTEALMAAAKACEGQTCALDTNTQASLIAAEIGSQQLLIEAAHARAAEAQLDYEQAAVERAAQHTLINWRGLDRYGAAPGS